MHSVFSLLFLALAVSIDNFGVGVTYGLRKIRIPIGSIAIIACCSGLVFLAAMLIGQWVAQFLSPEAAKITGACLLIGIGCWAIWQIRGQSAREEEADSASPIVRQEIEEGERTVLQIELKRLGLVIQILKTPQLADVDRSGNISASEALLLGMALSLDAFGAGIGAAFIGFAPVLTAAVVALAGGSFITAGLRAGWMFSDTAWLKKLSILPGCILIIIGFLKLM